MGEGEVYDLGRLLDASAIVGDVSAEIDWGDGRTSTVPAERVSNASGIRVTFDYVLDDNNFFSNQAARRALEFAAATVASQFTDTLARLGPRPSNIPDLQYEPFVLHPSRGPANVGTGNPTNVTARRNVVLNQNEIRVFAGARPMTVGNRTIAAYAGTGDVDFDPVQCIPDCDTVVRRRDLYEARGQNGVLASPPTDVAPTFASIGFNTNLDWDFSINEAAAPGKVDFVAVATHELAHVFGFGLAPSWRRYISGSNFTGPKASAAYQGGNRVPVDGIAAHWAQSVKDVQPTVMTPFVDSESSRNLSAIDLAGLDDIGWTRKDPRVRVNASHVFADNGVYTPTITLVGSGGGRVTISSPAIRITNELPSLEVSEGLEVVEGQAFDVVDIGSISDPGYRNTASAPRTEETFTYSINWGDGSNSSGQATIDRTGNSTRDTLASFDGGHTYDSAGLKTVEVTVTDDDGGTVRRTFTINVLETLSVQAVIDSDVAIENQPSSLDPTLTLTLNRAVDVATPISIRSLDTTRIRVSPNATIRIGQTSIEVGVTVIDDNRANGDVPVTLVATLGDQASEVVVLVRDDEVTARQNTVLPVDVNDDEELTAGDALLIINMLISGSGLGSSGIFADVNGDASVTPGDALLVINALISRAAMGESEPPAVLSNRENQNVLLDEAYRDWPAVDSGLF